MRSVFQAYSTTFHVKSRYCCEFISGTSCCLEDMDYVLFHSPYCKLVQKSLSRLTLIDFVGNKMKHYSEEKRRLFEELSNVKYVSPEVSFLRYLLATLFCRSERPLFRIWVNSR